MKIPELSHPHSNRENGSAVIVMLALLALVVGFITANCQVLASLRGEMQLIEQKQIRRLDHSTTNAPPQSAADATAKSVTAQVAKPVGE
jgi:hypothetical protein